MFKIRNVMKSRGNNPKRRIVLPGHFTAAELASFATRARYEGSALHKIKAANYAFVPPTSPRASKSVCDDLRVIKLGEAQALLDAAFAHGMVSACDPEALPKYAWAVDADGEAYEAKLGRNGYHGYRLGRDDRVMRDWVIDEWRERVG
ncbi:MAG: hypothetical protein OXK76_05480 [Gammaproteobacteria bacterium]|nr:hypothetical protein [Gammaproteobacteria bacterium]